MIVSNYGKYYNGTSATKMAAAVTQKDSEIFTRKEMASILYKTAVAMGLTPDAGSESKLSAFADSGDVSSENKAAVVWAVSEGIINGTSATTLAPLASTTRAQFVTAFSRFMGWCDEYGLTVFTFSSAQNPASLDRYNNRGTGNIYTYSILWGDMLVNNNHDDTYSPWLATSWEWNEYNTSITFHLRDDVKSRTAPT